MSNKVIVYKKVAKNFVFFVFLWFIFHNFCFSQNDTITYCGDKTLTGVQTSPRTHLSKTKMTLENYFVADGANNRFVFGIDEQIICSLSGDNIVPYQATTNNHNTNLPVGVTAGVADVSATGAATYTIPIFVSPGINSMEPQIALNYNSQNGNGILGIGWSLSGFSAISLAPNAVYNDGYFEAIKFGGAHNRYSERYALDGNRLVELSSNNFRTEIESFQKIDKSGSGTNIKFTLHNKNGITTFYGQTPNSRIMLDSNNILSWLIDKIEDPNGNYITYEYYDDREGEKLIKTIRYTGNQNAGIQPFNSIEFYYGERADKSHSYISGTKFNQTVVLEKIRIICEEHMVKEYFFKYFIDNQNNTKLTEIIEKANNGTALNSTIVNWGNNGSVNTFTTGSNYSFKDSVSGTIYSGPFVSHFTGDFNGDGLPDFVVNYNFTKDEGDLRKTYIIT
jgi:hypothetical protein